MATGRFISYLRVSTDRQGKSGLGLEAQRKAVADFLNGGSWELLGEFVEVESGKRNDRPQLAAALEACRKQRATLVIAKLDRLSRNLAFIARLLDSKVDILAADMPEANRTMLQMMAVFAEHERRMISERTKAALAAAKARGRRLGWANPARCDQPVASGRGAAAASSRAHQFAGNVLPVIEAVRRSGVHSLQGIADALNARGVATARGGRWYAGTVRNVISRKTDRQEAA